MTEVPVETPTAGDGRIDLGERLRAIRLLRQRTLREVAGTADVSESFLSQLERGRSSASVATLQRLAGALGIEISDLFATNGLPRPTVLRREARELLVWGHLGRKALLTPKPFHALEVVAAESGEAAAVHDPREGEGEALRV